MFKWPFDSAEREPLMITAPVVTSAPMGASLPYGGAPMGASLPYGGAPPMGASLPYGGPAAPAGLAQRGAKMSTAKPRATASHKSRTTAGGRVDLRIIR